MIKKYTYNNKVFKTTWQLRQQIWKNQGKIYDTPKTAEQWSKLGVVYTEQEQALDTLKTRKIQQLESTFNSFVKSNASYFTSSLGFESLGRHVDMINILATIKLLEGSGSGGAAEFIDRNDVVHDIDLKMAQTLQAEMTQHGTICYAQKTVFLENIQNAQSKADLDAIDIKFGPTNPTIASTFAYPVAGGISYYACMDEPLEVVPKESGALFFDDELTHGGAYLEVDRIQKAYGIQKTDDKDPNITGGSSFNVVAVAAMSGVAPSDGKVRLWIQALDQLRKPKGILTDENGNPMAVEKHYKAGDKLDRLVIDRFVNAKAMTYFRVMVDNGFDDPLLLEDRTEGNTCLLIQESTEKSRTGEGGLQFQLDSGISLKSTRHYFGTGVITTSWLTQMPVPIADGTAGDSSTMADGWGLNALSNLKAGVADGKIQILSNGTDIADFDFHKIMSPEKTALLRGKTLSVSFVGETPDNGFEVALMKWVGDGKANPKILASRSNTVPSFSQGWVKAGSFFVSQNVQGSQTITNEFTVPTDAKQFAICIYPVQAQIPCTLRITKLQCDAKMPFTTHIHAPTGVLEDRLFYREGMQRFIQDNDGYSALCYTVNNMWSNCPVGFSKDQGDVTLNDKVQVIHGSAATGGEGALLFPNDGTADISVTFRVLNEQKYESLFTAKLVYVDDTGTVADLPSDIVTVKIAGGSVGSVVTLRAKGIDVKAKEMIGIQFRSDKKDGCYLQSTSRAEPLVETIVDYNELIK